MKLFETDVMLSECTAIVTACEAIDNGFLVELNQTVMFPEGGGQLSDCGLIGDVHVTHVREREGRILHLCDSPLTVGESYLVKLDWNMRLDHMQQHTGEHILSHILWSKFDANNVGFHMSSGRQVTIDMDKELTPEQLIEAENYANAEIWADRKVTTHLITSDKLDDFPMRKKTDKIQGLLRVVEIEGGDCCTCCGTHLPRTGMVGQIKIIRQERYKGGVRIRFLCGRWALEDYGNKNETVLNLGAMLSVKPDEIVSRVEKLKENAATMKKELKALQKQTGEQN